MSQKPYIRSEEEHAHHKREALNAVRRMAFPPGTEFVFHRDGATQWKYIRVKGDPDTCPLLAWGRHAYKHGHVPHLPISETTRKESPWLAAGYLHDLPIAVAYMITSAAADYPLADPDVRAALLVKCGFTRLSTSGRALEGSIRLDVEA